MQMLVCSDNALLAKMMLNGSDYYNSSNLKIRTMLEGFSEFLVDI